MNDQLLFAMFYSNLVAMLLHPGNKAGGITTFQLQSCAEIAEEMLSITKGKFVCPSSHQH